MKIKRIDFRALRNNEHFQCQTEFKALIETFNPATLNIESLFGDTYLPLYDAEDEALVKIIKNTFSDQRSDTDRLRDQTFRGSSDTILAGVNHFDPEVREAARRLKIVFDRFGNVAQLPLNEETSAIYNLVQEVTENHRTDAEKLGLIPWMNKLKSDNESYEALVTGGYEEEASKTELKAKETRTEVDKVVRQIIERIEAFIVIEGEANYSEFVRRLNLILDRYANTLAQRKGIAKAKTIKN
jgi:hypothetical protein